MSIMNIKIAGNEHLIDSECESLIDFGDKNENNVTCYISGDTVVFEDPPRKSLKIKVNGVEHTVQDESKPYTYISVGGMERIMCFLDKKGKLVLVPEVGYNQAP